MPPLLPEALAPVLKLASPLFTFPDVVSNTREPLLPDVLKPLKMRTLPPVSLSLDPASTVTSPPLPFRDPPLIKLMLPLSSLLLSPVKI
jgi:hypothetical protein